MKILKILLVATLGSVLIACDSGFNQEDINIADPSSALPYCVGSVYNPTCYSTQPTSITNFTSGGHYCQYVNGSEYQAPGPMYPYEGIDVCTPTIGVTINGGLLGGLVPGTSYMLRLEIYNPTGGDSWNLLYTHTFFACNTPAYTTSCPSVYFQNIFGPTLINQQYRLTLILTNDLTNTPIYQTVFTFSGP